MIHRDTYRMVWSLFFHFSPTQVWMNLQIGNPQIWNPQYCSGNMLKEQCMHEYDLIKASSHQHQLGGWLAGSPKQR